MSRDILNFRPAGKNGRTMRIFMSHHNGAAPLVRELRGRLPEHIDSWVDEYELVAGDHVGNSLRSAIQTEVDFVVLLWDKGAAGSDWVSKELQWALDEEDRLDRIFLLPVILDDAPLPATLGERLYLECLQRSETAVTTLAESLSKAIFRRLSRDIETLRLTPNMDVDGSQHRRLRLLGRSVPNENLDRPYSSIDSFDLRVSASGGVTGVIERLQPARREACRWACSGYLNDQMLLLTFSPLPAVEESGPRPVSYGHMTATRPEGRGAVWPTSYRKFEPRYGRQPKKQQFKYELATEETANLVESAGTVAVIDFDNTLARGWMLGPWLHELAAKDVGDARGGSAKLDALFAEYQSSTTYGHDRLASEALAIYAEAVAGVAYSDLEERAGPFVHDYLSVRERNLFAHARDLLTGLRQRGIRPVLVTGGPSELVASIASELGFGLYYASECDRDQEGRFTGTVSQNCGTAAGKSRVCDELEKRRECELLVAVGDSEGDEPMWTRAEVAIRVGGPQQTPGLAISGLDLDSPLSAQFWTRLPTAAWKTRVAELADLDNRG